MERRRPDPTKPTHRLLPDLSEPDAKWRGAEPGEPSPVLKGADDLSEIRDQIDRAVVDVLAAATSFVRATKAAQDTLEGILDRFPDLAEVIADGGDCVIFPVGLTLHEAKMRYLRHELERLGGNKMATARSLGINRKTLYNLLHEKTGPTPRG